MGDVGEESVVRLPLAGAIGLVLLGIVFEQGKPQGALTGFGRWYAGIE
ncbi:MAG: hypothetical protein O7H41_21025 [Planctomycetota bacterium]|nr:hypothetical protein [Planctomycetota bacterium]